MPPVRTGHIPKETDEVFAYLPMDRQRYTPNPKPSITNNLSLRPLTPLTQATNTMTGTSDLARTIKETGPTRTPSKRSTLSRLFHWPTHRSSLTPLGEQHYYASLMAACPRRAEAYTEVSSQSPLKEVAARRISSQQTDTKAVLGSPSATSATLTANLKGLRTSFRSSLRRSLTTSVNMKPTDFGDGKHPDKDKPANESEITTTSLPTINATGTLASPSTQVSNTDFAKQSPASSFYPGIEALLSDRSRSDNANPLKDIQVPAESPLPLPSVRSSEIPDRKHSAPRHFARPLPDGLTFNPRSPLYLSRPRIHFDGSPRARVPKDKSTGDVSLQASKYAALPVGSEDGRSYVPFPSRMFPQGPPPTCPTPPAPDGTRGIQHNLSPSRLISISAKHTYTTEALSSRSMEALCVPSKARKSLPVPGRPNDYAWDGSCSDSDNCTVPYSCFVAPLTPRSIKTPPKAAHVTKKYPTKAAQDAMNFTRKMVDYKMALEAQKQATSSKHPKHAPANKGTTTVGLGIDYTLSSKHAGNSNEPQVEIRLARDGQNNSELMSSKISNIEEESVDAYDNDSIASPLSYQGSQSRSSRAFETGKELVATDDNKRPSSLIRESALTRRTSQKSSRIFQKGKEPVATNDNKRGSLLLNHGRSQSRSSNTHDAEKGPVSTDDNKRGSTSLSRGRSQFQSSKFSRIGEEPFALDSQRHAAELRARELSLTRYQRTPSPVGIGRMKPSNLKPYGRTIYYTTPSPSDTEKEPVATDDNKRISTALTREGSQLKHKDTPTTVLPGRLRPSELMPYGRIISYTTPSAFDTEKEPVATDDNKRISTALTRESSQSKYRNTSTPVGAGRMKASDLPPFARHVSVGSPSSTGKHISFAGPHEEPTSAGKRTSFAGPHEGSTSTAKRVSFASEETNSTILSLDAERRELQRENSRLREMLKRSRS